MKSGLPWTLALAAAAVFPARARGQEVAAVLSSDQSAYREVYEGFQAAFGRPVPRLAPGDKVPDSADIVLAFGGKAAVSRYPGRVVLIYAVAPSVVVGRDTHDGTSIKIMMEPQAEALIRILTAIQPGLKRLAVLWSSAGQAASAERLVRVGAARGVAVSAERLEDGDGLPGRLRELMGREDAIWLAPDPALVNARNFSIIKEYSYDNGIPFYAPTAGLAEQGATAAVSVGYREMGRTMAAAAKSVLAGNKPPSEIYSDRVRVTVNQTAAKAVALAVPAEVVKNADKVYP
ncbi:MAG: hypothetical protein KGJ84_10800 [Elusimicrobia bacterium]|nr:hypothetical protein [Elusimicrobiota bacterium]